MSGCRSCIAGLPDSSYVTNLPPYAEQGTSTARQMKLTCLGLNHTSSSIATDMHVKHKAINSLQSKTATSCSRHMCIGPWGQLAHLTSSCCVNMCESANISTVFRPSSASLFSSLSRASRRRSPSSSTTPRRAKLSLHSANAWKQEVASQCLSLDQDRPTVTAWRPGLCECRLTPQQAVLAGCSCALDRDTNQNTHSDARNDKVLSMV